MLQLLGGPPRCGKSTFAPRAASAHGCSYAAEDDLILAVGGFDARYDEVERLLF